METRCISSPENKKEYISEIGKILVERHGKKKFYSPKEVKAAHKNSSFYDGIDYACWAMSIFSSHSDFDKHHQEEGELCDYSEMKSLMLHGLSVEGAAPHPGLIPEIDIDSSWLDFGDLFENIFSGIGNVIDSIFDNL